MWFIEAIKNEPFTILGFVGAAIVWIRSLRIQKAERLDDLADTLDEAQYIFDRVRNKQIFMQGIVERSADEQTRNDYLMSISNVLKYIEDYHQQISEFDRTDASRKNLSQAADLVAKARRMDGNCDDTIAIQRGEAPTKSAWPMPPP